MTEDIQKAIDAGKLTPHSGKALAALTPGSFCFHKSWGFGRIETLNFIVNQATIHFDSKRGHTMQLQYAAESLEPIPAGHILAEKATNLAGVKKQAKDDNVSLVRMILKSFGGHATQEQFVQTLVPDVFTDVEFKKWWDATKKALKKDGHFAVPAKKTEPIMLREEAISRADELLAKFAAARQLKEHLSSIDQIIKNLDAFEHGVEQLQPVLVRLEADARRNQRLHTAQSFELILSRDEIVEKLPALSAGESALTVSRLIREEERRLTDIFSQIPAAKQKRLFAEFPKAFGEAWAEKALGLMLRGGIRVVAEIARLLQENGKHDALRRELDRWISDHSITTEILYWLCKERTGNFADLISPQVFSAILSALERDQFSDIKRGGKLHDLLLDDRELIPDLLNSAEPEIARDSMRRLMLTPVFEELNKRSLLGRLIRTHPELQAMLSGETSAGEKQEALVVSWESLEKRKEEYEDLIKKKIPENTKEISIARSYGDLRENFEFKAAKEMQRVLMRRKSEMESGLSRARGTNYENADSSQVSIGTIVTVKNLSTGQTKIYKILGAWDSEPDKGVISYLTAIGQALLGHKIGEQLDLPSETGTDKIEIVGIEAYRVTADASPAVA